MTIVSNELNKARVKASREALIARIGIEEYRRQENLKRKARRSRAARETLSDEFKSAPVIEPLVPSVPFTIPVVQLEKNVPITVPIDDKCKGFIEKIFLEKQKYYSKLSPPRTIKKSSVVQQFNRVSNMYKNMFKVSMNCSDLEWLRDTDRVVGFVNGYFRSPNSRVSNISAIASILQVMPEYEAEYEVYSKLLLEEKREILKNAEENKTTPKEQKNILSWDKLKDLYKNENMSPEHRALIALYTLIPPRRIQDMQLLTITNTEVNNNPNLNYIVVKRGIPTKLIFNEYKTRQTYGVQSFDMTKDLANALKPYIRDKKVGDPIFPNKDNKYIKNFSEYLTSIFKKYTGKNISVNLIRHAFVSDYLKKNTSIAEKKEISNKMSHSITSQGFYNRIDLE